jgi:uncharacterized protein (TIGR04551 family)
MLRTFVVVSVSLSSVALAQVDGGVAAPTASPSVTPSAESDVDALKRELDSAKKEMKDMREEMRAQLANQSVAQGWQEDWVPEKRKLETFVPDGYFRIRPELLYHMDLGRGSDPSGYELFPRSPASQKDRTEAGVNMRFRFEPTFNISEEVRIRTQIDMLDNVLMGTTPDYAFTRDPNRTYDLQQYGIFSMSQVAPQAGINSLGDSVKVKRVWGEVSTPVGILRFGRMGSHWGLGMLHNDGNCLDCDLGDTVDRIQFVAEPIAGWYIAPAIDFNVEGPYSSINGQPFDLSNSDDAHSLVLAAARRDTESQAKAKIDAGGTVFNFGVHFTYRWQKDDAADYYLQPFTTDGTGLLPRGAVAPNNAYGGYVQRWAHLYMPDVWVKVERKEFRVELEAAVIGGDIFNSATTGQPNGASMTPASLGVLQFGAVLQAEYRLLDQALKIGIEVGFASGDPAPGFGYYPARKVAGVGGQQVTQPGDIDGPQWNCPPTGGCSGAGFDNQITNFRFNPSFRPDLILFREIIGGVTDALYIKPNASYRVADGFNVFAAVIYSRAIFASSTPSAGPGKPGDANLGIEINAGARYETEDGFFGQLEWGILFPLPGLANSNPTAISFTGVPVDLESAQALRASIGIRF